MRFRIPEVVLGFLLATGLWAVAAVTIPPPQNQHIQQANSHADAPGENHKITKSFGERLSIIWDRTWEDPVAFYTFVLGIFTGLLFIVSATQIGFLFSANRAARIAANAAKEHADAAVASHRPYMFVEKIITNFTSRRAVVEYRIQNVGSSVAMLEEYSVNLRVFETVPDLPPYLTINPSRLAIFEGEIIPEKDTKMIEDDDILSETETTPLVKTGPEFLRCVIHPDDAPLLYNAFEDEEHFHLYLFGYFGYSDVFGKARQTGFGYDLTDHNRRTIAGSAYNYDREIEQPKTTETN